MILNSNAKTYHIITYGCQMNENDSERLAGQLQALGYEEIADKTHADVIIINTCCVRESAEQKIYGKIGELKKLKQNNRNLILGISGCLAQKEKETLIARAPHIDFVIGTNNMHNLKEIINNLQSRRNKIIITDENYSSIDSGIAVRKNKISAWVPIMQGCNNFCTYCIVPYVRGREKSRSSKEIIDEVKQLGQDGFKEITLLGQNVNSYGKDMNEIDFAELLKKIDDVDGIRRIRYMTSHPRDMSEKIIKAIKESKKVCRHFHLPIQSGSDFILRKMNRGYSVNEYKQTVNIVRSLMPEASITTDIIVGFPGETDELFKETLEFLQEIKFDAAYTFMYSIRSGTPAALLTDQVTSAIKKERLHVLMNVQNEISLAINKTLVGKKLEVMVEGPSKNNEHRLTGRSDNNKIILWDRQGFEKVGDFYQLQITEAQTWILKGNLDCVKSKEG